MTDRGKGLIPGDLGPREVKVVSSDGSFEIAKIYNMHALDEFLSKNGFSYVTVLDNPAYQNERCLISVHTDYYEVKFKDGKMYSRDLNAYWLIGVLTYHDLIDKDYKK